ncbi:sodium-coupled monocarboxylate transporter 1-like [Haliotis asinina]|uniref:sodium-coupled monocarboxylate transporter 1-like n=1 Tax=Haliotis asinina TaxID=109174 RepID=UPI003531A2A7
MDEERKYSYQTGEKSTFGIIDYVLFGGLLLVSASIGLFYAIKDRKKHTTKDFLLAGGDMHVVPVALSLLASFMSAITILGTPSEMYKYGTMYGWIGLSYLFAVFLSAHIYIPIFYRIGITSSYEYLEFRFGPAARLAGAMTYIVQMTIYMACVLYAPSLALNAVTDFDLWGSIWAVGLVCTFYTSIGGMKAVLWTDTFQTFMMIIGLLAVLIQGCLEIGGFARAWEIAFNNSRVEFLEFSPDPSVRHSVWSLVIGGTFLWTFVYGVNQAQVQRAVACPTLRKAQIAYWINCPGLAIILYLTAMIGIVIYGFYSRCDPLSLGLISAGDQLLPLFVMDVLGKIPGIPGLFLACMFSGALSTISSGLNSISAVILTDIIRKYCCTRINEKKATIISKILAVVIGFAAIGLTYVAAMLGGILEAALALYGILGGPLLGAFTLGMLFPWANQIGAVVGIIASLVLMFWISVGFQIYKPAVATLAPISMVDCNFNITGVAATATTTMTTLTGNASSVISNVTAEAESNPLLGLYTLSYMWYTATAVATVVVVGLIVSFISGATKPETVDPRLMSPFFDIVFPYLPEKILKPLRFGVRYEKMFQGKRDSIRRASTRSSVNPHLQSQNEKEGGVVDWTIDNPDVDKGVSNPGASTNAGEEGDTSVSTRL